jgi:DNA polymerase III subunit epsilon
VIHWLRSFFNNRPKLTQEQQKCLAAWHKLPKVRLDTPIKEMRCVVVDVETTGLNLMNDRLISIGAVAIVNGRIAMGDSFYVVVQQQAASDKGNILLHGIGGEAQLEGMPPAESLLDFLEYLGKSPLIAFHVTFDETMIKRAIRDYLGFSFKHPWLDLAYLMPGLNPPLANKYRALDDWIGHYDIHIDVRHNAFADALATAQLFQIGQAQARQKKITDMAGLHNLEKVQRWVSAVS